MTHDTHCFNAGLLHAVSVRDNWPGAQPGPIVRKGGHAEDDAANKVSQEGARRLHSISISFFADKPRVNVLKLSYSYLIKYLKSKL